MPGRVPLKAEDVAAVDGEHQRLVTALLAVPTRELSLPPALMRLYLHLSWPDRRELLVGWLLIMAAVNLACAPLDLLIMTTGETWPLAAGRFGLSALFGLGALVIGRTERNGLEGPIVMSLCMAMVALVGVGSHSVAPDFAERWLSQAMFACAIALVVARIPWRDVVALAVLLVAALAVALVVGPGLQAAEDAQLFLFYASGVAALTLARRAQNRFLYRAFLLSLNERFKLTEAEGMNGRLAELARTDPLTLLANRRRFDELFETLSAGGAPSTPLCVFMIDIDHFKRLNDEYGHAAGDDCLRIVASAIRGELRDAHDLVARYGGEEFVALLPGVSLEEAQAAAERVRAAVAAKRIRNARSPFGVVTVSVGVAVTPPSPAGLLVAEADAALYEAKSMGRNLVRSSRSGPDVQVA